MAFQTARAPHTLHVRSQTFAAGSYIPKANSGYGENIAPQLSWGPTPKGTLSVVVFAEDPDAPGGLFTHWVIYNIDPKVTSIAAGTPSNRGTLAFGLQGMNDAQGLGYFGPQPPDAKVHHYHFEVFALNTRLRHRPGYSRNIVYFAMLDHILAAGEIVGLFKK